MVSYEEYEAILKEYKNMSLSEAIHIIGCGADWELNVMHMALNITPLMLDRDEVIRLKALNIIRRNKKEYYKKCNNMRRKQW